MFLTTFVKTPTKKRKKVLYNVCVPVTQQTNIYTVQCVKCSFSNNWLKKTTVSECWKFSQLNTCPNQKALTFSRITSICWKHLWDENVVKYSTLKTTTQRDQLTLHLESWQIALDRSERHKDVFLLRKKQNKLSWLWLMGGEVTKGKGHSVTIYYMQLFPVQQTYLLNYY